MKKLLTITKTKKRTFVDFSENDLAILQEYVKLTAPIAQGINRLQGDKDTFYGDLLPTLFTVKAKLEKLSTTLPKLGNLARVLVKKLAEKRFKKEFELGDNAEMAICSAISNPNYKAQWGSEADSEKAMAIFKREYTEVSNAMEGTQTAAAEADDSSDFILLRTAPPTSVSNELTRYLVDARTDFKMLDQYPVIREIFFKSNTQLPTSASAERMFNFAGLLDHPNRGRILPTNFENNVVVKANAVYARSLKQ